MTASCYLIFDKSGIIRSVKSENFELKPGELATKVVLEVDDSVFAPQRVPTVTFTLDPNALRRTMIADPPEERP